jgi:CheY-like chemotaxis protein
MTALNRRILVVDDNPAIHADYRKVLCPERRSLDLLNALDAKVLGGTANIPPSDSVSFELDSALQGQEALELVNRSLAEKNPYSVAFIDMRMDPGWNGLETIRHIWKVNPELQVVLCSAYSDFTWREIVDTLGATDNFVILRKPFDSIEVIQLAMALSKKWEASRQVQAHMAELGREVMIRTQQAVYVTEKLREGLVSRSQPNELFSIAFEQAPFPMAIINIQRLAWVEVNKAFARLCDLELDAFRSQSSEAMILLKKQPEALLDVLIQAGSAHDVNCEFRSANGSKLEVTLSRESLMHKGERHALIYLEQSAKQLT